MHTLFLALFLVMLGMLCLISPTEVYSTSLGKKICSGLALFWLLRLIVQFVGYSPKLWMGKAFETRMHVLFCILWTYFTVVFSVVALG